MVDFKIRRGLSTLFYSEPGVINPRLVIEEGCWYLCTDTAELFLGVNDPKNGLILKQINGANATDKPTQKPEVSDQPDTIIGLEINEAGELVVLYSTGNDEVLGRVVGEDGKDGLTTAIKIGDKVYSHNEGVIELTDIVTKDYLDEKLANVEVLKNVILFGGDANPADDL